MAAAAARECVGCIKGTLADCAVCGNGCVVWLYVYLSVSKKMPLIGKHQKGCGWPYGERLLRVAWREILNLHCDCLIGHCFADAVLRNKAVLFQMD